MTKQYYLHDGTELQGPFLFEALKAKNISPDAHVWYEGLDEWTKAAELEELNTFFASPGFFAVPGPSSQQQHSMSQEAPEQKNKKRGMSVLLIILLIAAMAAVGLYWANQSAAGNTDTMQISYLEKIMTIEEIERSMPNDFLSVLGEPKENFWENNLMIRGTITNKATVASYKEAVIRVTYYSKAMTELGSKEHIVCDRFPPNSSTPFEFKTDNYQDVAAVGLSLLSAVGE